MIQADKT